MLKKISPGNYQGFSYEYIYLLLQSCLGFKDKNHPVHYKYYDHKIVNTWFFIVPF